MVRLRLARETVRDGLNVTIGTTGLAQFQSFDELSGVNAIEPREASFSQRSNREENDVVRGTLPAGQADETGRNVTGVNQSVNPNLTLNRRIAKPPER